ncbi:MAG: glycosyltransferase family 4 protein [Candidatus Sumerlaeia bacterium]|nr:glycosyltransferase family 4 protein [Candidatus Sumerlaeia bacterium]
MLPLCPATDWNKPHVIFNGSTDTPRPGAGLEQSGNMIAGTPRPLRILQLASHADMRRGGAVQMIRLATELKQRGHEVVCAFNADQPHPNSPTHPICPPAPNAEIVRFNLRRWRDALRFRRWCRDMQFDIVHAHRDEALVFACEALLGLKCPRIVAGRGTVYRLRPLTQPWFWFRSRKVRAVVAVAEAVKKALTACGVPVHKIHVIYGSVDEAVFHPAVDGSALRAEWGGIGRATDVHEPLLVGNVAALVMKKGHEEFFEAAAKVRARIPSARFVCIGAGKPEKFREHLARLGIADCVVFAGHRDDMPHVYAALDVVVSSSTKGEGLNGAIREAMACGRPVVATDVGGNRELVHNGENGFLVPPGDAGALAHAILELLSNPERAQTMGRAARQTILSGFTNRHRGDAIEALYYRLYNE